MVGFLVYLLIYFFLPVFSDCHLLKVLYDTSGCPDSVW